MFQQQLICDLKTSYECAETALSEIYKKIKILNAQNRSTRAYNIVHSVCMAMKANGEFYELYAEAVVRLVDSISDGHWNIFLQLVRYILGELYSKNVYWEQTKNIVKTIKADRVKDSSDFIYHLKIYCRQLVHCHMHMNEQDIKELLEEIDYLLAKYDVIKGEEFIVDFYQEFVGSAVITQNIFKKYYAFAKPVLEKFITILSSLKFGQNKNETFIQLTKYIVQLIQLDIWDSKSTLSQNFLRSWKNNSSLNTNKQHYFVSNCFYCFVKQLLFPNSPDFCVNLVKITKNFLDFLKREELKKESWFYDTVVTITRILCCFKTDKGFLQALNEEATQSIIDLVGALVQVAHLINYNSGLWMCCNSVRKHIVFRLCAIDLAMLEVVVAKKFTKPDCFTKVYQILSHTLDVAEFFKCASINHDLTSMIAVLNRCAMNVKMKDHAKQMSHLLRLPGMVKAQTKDNTTKFIIKSLIHLHKVSEEKEAQVEAHALYIGQLLTDKCGADTIMPTIGLFYNLSPALCVLETLDNSSFPLKPKEFDRRLLYQMEVEVMSQSKNKNTSIVQSLLKVAETNSDYVLTVRCCPQSDVVDKLDKILIELKTKSNPKPTELVTLGRIYAIKVIQKVDQLKHVFSFPKITESILSQILDSNDLRKVDVASEMQLIHIALDGIECFKKFFEFAKNHVVDDNVCVDWEGILEDIALFARHFYFRGYLDYAYISYGLLFQIGKHIRHSLIQILALSFICGECVFVELYDQEFSIWKEVKGMEKEIYEYLQMLHLLSPRKQNNVLLCLCNLAWYLAQKNLHVESSLLLDLALAKVDELVQRKGKFDFVRAVQLAISFRIKWKLLKGMSSREAYIRVDNILDEFRKIVYISPEDSVNFPTLLFSVVNDITEFTTNRLAEPATLPYVYMVLKLALELGAALRLIQFLAQWTHVNLQTENLANCQLKLDLIEVLCRRARSCTSIRKKKNLEEIDLKPNLVKSPLIVLEEAIQRKDANRISPVLTKCIDTKDYIDFDNVLIVHDPTCTCTSCSHVFIKWQVMKIGCLTARLLYLGSNFNDPNEFYSKAIAWCTMNCHKSYIRYHFRDWELSMLIQYINVLRRIGNHKEALRICQTSHEIYSKYQTDVDLAYYVNIQLQLSASKRQIEGRKAKTNPTNSHAIKLNLLESKNRLDLKSKQNRKGRKEDVLPSTLNENLEENNNINITEIPGIRATKKIDAFRFEKTKKAATRITNKLNNAILLSNRSDDSAEASTTRKVSKKDMEIQSPLVTRSRVKQAPATIAVTRPRRRVDV